MAPFAKHPLLDLDGSQRFDSWRFDLLDRDRNRSGSLTADAKASVTIDHNANRSIKRTLSGLRLLPTETLAINPLADSVQPVLVLADGSEWAFGVFYFADLGRARTTAGVEQDLDLVDGGIVVDVGAPRSVAAPAGGDVSAFVRSVLAEAGLPDAVVDETGARFSTTSPPTWKAGTTWLAIATEAGAVGGLYSPAFAHDGRCYMVRPGPADDTAQADVYYEPGGRIIDGTIEESDNSLEAPNRYICVDTAANDAPIMGIYDVPDASPFSAASRGRVITTTVEAQGVGSNEAAAARAQAAYLSSRFTDHVAFSTPVDPRHDLWTVVAYRDGVYREQQWKVGCSPGAPMTHDLRRTYR